MDIEDRKHLPTCGNVWANKSYVKCGNKLKLNVKIYEHDMWKHEATLFSFFFQFNLYEIFTLSVQTKIESW